MENKKVIELDRYEHGLLINALNEFRTKLINEKSSTEPVDELLLKVIDAPNKKRTFTSGKVKGSYCYDGR